jgi:hypothetical protein
MAENEDLLDESRHLSDVRPFCSVFRLIERKGDKAENTLNIQISHLIGKGMYMHKVQKFKLNFHLYVSEIFFSALRLTYFSWSTKVKNK